MVLILLNILVLFGLFANNFGQGLLNTVSGSFREATHRGDQAHTPVQLGTHPTPEMGCSHTQAQVKPTAKQDGSASPSLEVKAVAIR